MEQPRSPATSVLVIALVATAAFGLMITPAAGAPIIQEVFYDAAGTDSGEVFTRSLAPSVCPSTAGRSLA